MMNKYIPLTAKTEGSILYSPTKAADLVALAKEKGFEAVGLCDIDSLSQCMAYWEACVENDMKPILGLQMRICDKPAEIHIDNPTNKRIILIAKNLNGWKTLLKILFISNKREYFDGGGRLSIEQLAAILTDDLIVIGHGDLSDREWDRLISPFVKGDLFYGHNPIELIPKISRSADLPVVPIFPNFYLKEEDKEVSDLLLCKMYGNITIDEANKDVHPAFESKYFCFQGNPERYQSIDDEMISNTRKVFDLIEKFEIAIPPQFVNVECPNGWDEDKYLRELCWAGMKKWGVNKDSRYLERIKFELDVIRDAGMSGYFLIMEDILSFCHKNDICVGFGRGSVGGCLISFLIGISFVDPLKHGLIFERFYSPSRKGYPDIDVDFQPSRREEVVQYLIDKYGSDHFMQLSTFGTLKGKSSLKVAMQGSDKKIPAELQNTISQLLPDETRIDSELEEQKNQIGTKSSILYCLLNYPERMEKWCKIDSEGNFSGDFSEEFKRGIELNSIIVSRGRHASAFVLGQQPLYTTVPVVFDKKSDKYVIGVDMIDGEKMGCIKLDLLGLTLLDEYSYCKELLNGKQIVQRIDGWRPVQV